MGWEGGCEYKTKMVKDVVHQFVELPSDFFESAVDTLGVQRLRDVKQLSLAHLVYPGAMHSRFEHSLGVAHVMSMALRSIANNTLEHVVPSLRRVKGTPETAGVAWSLAVFLSELAGELKRLHPEAVTAALYHDAGHIALSHPGERAFRDPVIYTTPDPDVTRYGLEEEFDHERLGLALVSSRAACTECGKVRYACKTVDMEQVVRILELAYDGGKWEKHCGPVEFKARDPAVGGIPYEVAQGETARVAECIIANLLNSPIDVDRADYTLRDSAHTGSRSGVWDIDRYYSVLTVVPSIESKSSDRFEAWFRVGVLDKGVSIVESMLLSRIYMYGDVYLHDVSMIYSAMASRTLALLYAVTRYLKRDADNGLGEARRLLEKYPVLEALADLPILARGGAPGGYRELEERLAQVTDTPVLDLIHRIALGSARDLFSYISTMRESASSDLKKLWFEEACTGLVLASRGLVRRRHWGSLILADERATKIIASLGVARGGGQKGLEAVESPLLIVSWSSYTPYRGEGKNKILVYRRKNPLTPVEVSESYEAKTLGKIAGVSYSKLLVSAPLVLEEPLEEGWYGRGGKLAGEDYATAARFCGSSEEEVNGRIKEAASRALKVASELLRYS